MVSRHGRIRSHRDDRCRRSPYREGRSARRRWSRTAATGRSRGRSSASAPPGALRRGRRATRSSSDRRCFGLRNGSIASVVIVTSAATRALRGSDLRCHDPRDTALRVRARRRQAEDRAGGGRRDRPQLDADHERAARGPDRVLADMHAGFPRIRHRRVDDGATTKAASPGTRFRRGLRPRRHRTMSRRGRTGCRALGEAGRRGVTAVLTRPITVSTKLAASNSRTSGRSPRSPGSRATPSGVTDTRVSPPLLPVPARRC